MNKNVKKILLIFIPVFILLITLSIIFGTKYSSKTTILNNTSDSEYVSYHTNYITSTETLESTPEEPIYQVKTSITLTNKCKFGVGTFDIKMQFIDELGNAWERVESVTLNGGTVDINFTEIKDCKTENLSSIGIKLHDSNFYAVLHDEQYENYYGKNNILVSDNEVEVFSILTIVFGSFTLISLVSGTLMILIYIDVDVKKSKKKRKSKTKSRK